MAETCVPDPDGWMRCTTKEAVFKNGRVWVVNGRVWSVKESPCRWFVSGWSQPHDMFGPYESLDQAKRVSRLLHDQGLLEGGST